MLTISETKYDMLARRLSEGDALIDALRQELENARSIFEKERAGCVPALIIDTGMYAASTYMQLKYHGNYVV